MPSKKAYDRIIKLLHKKPFNPKALRSGLLRLQTQEQQELAFLNKKRKLKLPIHPKDDRVEDYRYHHDGRSLLMEAVRLNNLHAVRVILDLYPDSINERDNHGYSALHMALWKRTSVEIVKELLARKADIAQVHEHGKNKKFSFLELTIIDKQYHKVEILTQYGAKLTVSTKEGRRVDFDDKNTPIPEEPTSSPSSTLREELEKGNLLTALHKGAVAGGHKKYAKWVFQKLNKKLNPTEKRTTLVIIEEKPGLFNKPIMRTPADFAHKAPTVKIDPNKQKQVGGQKIKQGKR